MPVCAAGPGTLDAGNESTKSGSLVVVSGIVLGLTACGGSASETGAGPQQVGASGATTDNDQLEVMGSMNAAKLQRTFSPLLGHAQSIGGGQWGY